MGLFFKKKQPDKEPTENRKFTRVNTSLRVNYQIANEMQRSDCRIKDISEKGVRFQLYQKLQAGIGIKLIIHMQDYAQPIFVIGRLAWVKETPGGEYPYEAGIEFEVFDPSLRAKIEEHIQERQKEEK